jgi:hypothetical protein
LLLAFSNTGDLDVFQAEYYRFENSVAEGNVSNKISYVIAPATGHGIITLKKWKAIIEQRKLLRYEIYVTMDSEIWFLKPIDKRFITILRDETYTYIGSDLDIVDEIGINAMVHAQREFFKSRLSKEQFDKVFEQEFKAFISWYGNVHFYRECGIET